VTKPNEASNKPSRPRVALAQRRKARRLIVQAMYQWLLAPVDVIEIEAQFRAEHTGKVDWDYFHDVFPLIPKQIEELEAHMTPFLDRDTSALDPVEKSLLYLGAFELAHRIDVPYRVVINEAVELAKVFGATDSHKYINGVMDRMARQLRAQEMPSKKTAS
jgi:transcription antitermination protein NusB